jgi:hypothetical protein
MLLWQPPPHRCYCCRGQQRCCRPDLVLVSSQLAETLQHLLTSPELLLLLLILLLLLVAYIWKMAP